MDLNPMADSGPSVSSVVPDPQTGESSIPPASATTPLSSKPRTRTFSHSLSSAAITNPASSRKGRHADPGTTETHADRANISMPSASTRPGPRSRTSSAYSQRALSSQELWRHEITLGSRASRDDCAIDDWEPRRLSTSTMAEDPDSTPQQRPSLAENDTKRMSVSSLYSLNSLRAGGPPSTAPSVNGSEAGTTVSSVTRSSSSKALGMSLPETSTSAVSITTSSGAPYGSSTVGGHQLTTRETPANAAELAKRNAAQRGEAIPRANPPTRSRSRAKRRFSGSTATSSHSPSSERGLLQKKEDEPKPYSWGVIGVCALDVKARSKPSRNILNRLISKGEFEVNVFGDKVILDEEVENWPICDFLICFYSDGFPLDKAVAYVRARKPFCVNDVPMQQILWDRRICLRILDQIKVPTPKRLEVNRDGGPSILTAELAKHLKDTTGVVLEGPEDNTGGKMVPPRKVELLDDGDTLSVDGSLLAKPFVEKPISGEDHNICIYFPKSQGGGARKLFRKIGNKSSEWIADMSVPRAILEPNSSYLYEKFMRVDNAEDVKAYTVGPQFCHAETRKSPVVDGLVRRNTYGKEIRYITSLSKDEAAIASRIATTFAQRVCGFDLLRADGKSFVIDVNGWSFVKDNEEYYDQCSRILKEMFIREKQKQLGNNPASSVSPSIPDTTMSPPAKRETPLKENHRSALHSILSKSPSISKLHGTHTKKGASTGSPDISLAPTPRTSPPLAADKTASASAIPASPLLPPPAIAIPGGSVSSTAPSTLPSTPSPSALEPVPPAPKHSWKLKGMVSVIRHADRTPKQKYKFTFHTKPFIDLLKGHQEEVLLTGEAALNSVIVAVELALQQGVEDTAKLKSLRNVLVKKGGWAGTKVQIKPMFRKRNIAELLGGEVPEPSSNNNPEDRLKRSPARNDSLSGVTLSRITAAEKSLVLDKLQLIVKWGGEPTHSARYQAQELGENMRNDLLLMNREVLDEVHVFSSSERRVTTSAQIWTSAFTDQKELPPDFITIRKDLLDDSNAAKDEMDKVKKKLKTLLREGNEPPPQFAWPANLPEPSLVMKAVVQLMKFHRRVMRYNYGKLYGGATSSLSAIANPGEKGEASPSMSSSMSQATATSSIQARWCCGEDADLFKERWEKLFGEFCDDDKVDPSKISELYDTMKFDALHNRQFLEWVFTPSKSMLEEEEEAVAQELRAEIATYQDDEGKEKALDKSQTLPMEKSESNKIARRMFRRKSVMTGQKSSEEAPESYFRLPTGGSQTKAMTDVRLQRLRELYKLAKVLFDFICPQEYGMADSEKLEIGLLTSLPLLKEIVQDLEEVQASDDAKSFVYFTKESHIYTLLNCILEGGIETKIKRSAIPELDYLSQICFELYESENKTPPEAGPTEAAKYAYSIRITISPGCHTFDPLDVQLDSKHCISFAPRRSLTAHADWKQVIETLRAKFHTVKLPKSFLAVNLSESHAFHKKDEDDANGDAHADANVETEDIGPLDTTVPLAAPHLAADADADADVAMGDAAATTLVEPGDDEDSAPTVSTSFES